MITTKGIWTLDPDRCYSAEPTQRRLARQLFEQVESLPLICPHGHVPPRLLADPAATLGTPADLFVIPDDYVTRMLYSQGVSLEALGVPTRDGPRSKQTTVRSGDGLPNTSIFFAAHLQGFG